MYDKKEKQPCGLLKELLIGWIVINTINKKYFYFYKTACINPKK
jgi:hypothetical protein